MTVLPGVLGMVEVIQLGPYRGRRLVMEAKHSPKSQVLLHVSTGRLNDMS
jgi:hypothetical protein